MNGGPSHEPLVCAASVPTNAQPPPPRHAADRHPCGVAVVDRGGPYAAEMADMNRRARVQDVHELAARMPHVTLELAAGDKPVYQIGRKSFVFFRSPRPDAVDPQTGERYRDVMVFWVPSEADKQALVQDHGSPFFTTAHFEGHPSVLLRASRIDELTRQELAELIQDAWLSRASTRRANEWLSAHR